MSRAQLTVLVGAVALATVIVALASAGADLRPEWVSSIAASASAVFAGATALVAWLTLGQVRRDSVNSSRPIVVAELRSAQPESGGKLPEGMAFQELVVRNVGRTVARNLSVSFEPKLPGPTGSSPTVDELVERYRRPIPSLPPGVELKNLYWGSFGLPTHREITVHLEYDGPDKRRWVDDYALDVRVVEHRTRLEVEGRRRDG